MKNCDEIKTIITYKSWSKTVLESNPQELREI